MAEDVPLPPDMQVPEAWVPPLNGTDIIIPRRHDRLEKSDARFERAEVAASLDVSVQEGLQVTIGKSELASSYASRIKRISGGKVLWTSASSSPLALPPPPSDLVAEALGWRTPRTRLRTVEGLKFQGHSLSDSSPEELPVTKDTHESPVLADCVMEMMETRAAVAKMRSRYSTARSEFHAAVQSYLRSMREFLPTIAHTPTWLDNESDLRKSWDELNGFVKRIGWEQELFEEDEETDRQKRFRERMEETKEKPGRWKGKQNVFVIPCDVGSANTEALGDTGSKHNVMRASAAQDWGLDIDHDSKRKIMLGGGKEVWTVGTASATFRFSNEQQSYKLKFQLLPDCMHDVILGNPFLQLTKTFSNAINFGRRVKRRLISAVRTFDFLYISGESGPMFTGQLAGIPQTALADTGAKVAVLDEDHANALGIAWRSGEQHESMLRFADESTAKTSGMAYDVPWCFGDDPDPHLLDFHVLKEAPENVILPDYLLLDTMAFAKYPQFLVDNGENDDYGGGDDDDELSHCFLITQDLKRRIEAGSSISDLEFEELVRQGEEKTRIERLPENEKKAADLAETQRRSAWAISMQVIRQHQSQGSSQSSGSANATVPVVGHTQHARQLSRLRLKWTRVFGRI